MNKIEIKPGDQSLVGVRLRRPLWERGKWVKVLCVGQNELFLRWDNGREFIIVINQWCDWELYEEPKQPTLLAPALYQEEDKWYRSCSFYSSLEDAKRGLQPYKYKNIQWPAIPNKDGFYVV